VYQRYLLFHTIEETLKNIIYKRKKSDNANKLKDINRKQKSDGKMTGECDSQVKYMQILFNQ